MQRKRTPDHLFTVMKKWFFISALAAVLSVASGCTKEGSKIATNENPDSAVSITYLGKGFTDERSYYGDLFNIEAPEGFTYDFTVTTDKVIESRYGSLGAFLSTYADNMVGNLSANGIAVKDYLKSGGCNCTYGILPEGDYTFYVFEFDYSGQATGICYSKKFTVGEYLSCKIDGGLSLQADWQAKYIGRYEDFDNTGASIHCDRISSSGTGDAYYYHVFFPAGTEKSEEELMAAFKSGSGFDDLKGGDGIVEWYKMIAPNYGYLAGLDWLLAKGDIDKSSGYMDYTLSGRNTGMFDVYTVEMLLNGHLTGRYGKTTLEISGTPDIKERDAVAGQTKAQIMKMRL